MLASTALALAFLVLFLASSAARRGALRGVAFFSFLLLYVGLLGLAIATVARPPRPRLVRMEDPPAEEVGLGSDL